MSLQAICLVTHTVRPASFNSLLVLSMRGSALWAGAKKHSSLRLYTLDGRKLPQFFLRPPWRPWIPTAPASRTASRGERRLKERLKREQGHLHLLRAVVFGHPRAEAPRSPCEQIWRLVSFPPLPNHSPQLRSLCSPSPCWTVAGYVTMV